MNNELLIYAASSMLFLWGIARFIYARTVVQNTNDNSLEGQLIFNFDLAAESIGISFIGLLSVIITLFAGSHKLGSFIVYLMAGGSLVVLFFWSIFSITRETTTLNKICPFIKLLLAAFYFYAALM